MLNISIIITLYPIIKNSFAHEIQSVIKYAYNNDPLSLIQDNPKTAAAFYYGGTKIAENTIPGGTAVIEALKYYKIKQPLKNEIREKTDLETSMASNKIIDEALNNPISTILSLPSALGDRKELGATNCEGVGCGHKIGSVITHIGTPLEKEKKIFETEKTEIDMRKIQLQTSLTVCAASDF